MAQQHPATAVAFQPKCIQRVTLGVLRLQQAQVGFPLVADHFSARETANWYDHFEKARLPGRFQDLIRFWVLIVGKTMNNTLQKS